MRFIVLASGIVLAFGSAACASSGTASADQTPTAATTRPRTNVISLQEIRESRAPSVADLIRQLRPGWPTTVTVFLNNDTNPFGDARTLSNLSVQNTTEIRYYTRSEAQFKWGSRFQESIQVITGR
ncbi:MAG TPA: hypothetical protein VF981_02025 [Gemmatimonadaceae bacterium]